MLVGLEREALVPLVRATLENWARQGARAALTGPIARGDLATAVASARRGRRIGARSASRSGTRSRRRRASSPSHRRRTRRENRSHRRRAARRRSLGAPRAESGSDSCRRWARSTTDISRSCGVRARRRGFVVVSLFVNPTQFNDPADLARYPRDESRDAELAGSVGVDLLFAPAPEEVYPPGFATTVEVAAPRRRRSRGRCAARALPWRRDGRDQAAQHGAARRGVLRPEGRAAGADHPSTRPRSRSPRAHRDLSDRARAGRTGDVEPQRAARSASRGVALRRSPRALARRRDAVAAGERDMRRAINAGRRRSSSEAGIDPEYFEAVSADTLDPVAHLDGETLVAIAARVGDVRLIDNVIVSPRSRDEPRPTDRADRRRTIRASDARRAATARRADRDAHRVRLSDGAHRAGGRRGRRARRRLGGETWCSATRSTREISIDELLVLTRAARRGVTDIPLVGDLPFGSYEPSDDDRRRHGAAVRRRGWLRRGEARGRRRDDPSRARDRRRRHSGRRPRRAAAAVGRHAGGLSRAGTRRRAGAPASSPTRSRSRRRAAPRSSSRRCPPRSRR